MYWRLGHLYKVKSPYDSYYATIGMLHMVNGILLDKIAFDIFRLEYEV